MGSEPVTEIKRSAATWWTRTLSGASRRVWVRKEGDYYHCAREVCDADQEAARARIFAAEDIGKPPAPQDMQLWSHALFGELRTSDAAEAWDFLGGDDIARCALSEADPALVLGHPGGAPS